MTGIDDIDTVTCTDIDIDICYIFSHSSAIEIKIIQIFPCLGYSG